MNTQRTDLQTIDKEWKADIVNQKNVSVEIVKFIFYQAEKRLEDGIKNYDATTTKSITFIASTSTLLTALTAYFFINFDPKGVFDAKLCTVIICCAYTLFVLYRFVTIILPKSYQPIGSYPQDLYVDSMMVSKLKATKYPKDFMLINFYLTELENYNCRIEENEEANRDRLNLFKESATYICLLPFVGIFVYFVLLVLSSELSL